MALPPAIRVNLYGELERDRPSLSQLDEWAESKALQYEVPVKQVKEWLARSADLMDLHTRRSTVPVAQRVANHLGMTRIKTLKRLNQMLDAKKCKIVTNRDGEVTKRIWLPDWDARGTAIKESNRLWGNYAPEVIEHRVDDRLTEIENLSLEEIRRRLVEKRRELNAVTLDAEVAGDVSGDSRTPGAGEGPAGAEGPILLPDGMHENDRRSGPEESIEIVPEETILPADN